MEVSEPTNQKNMKISDCYIINFNIIILRLIYFYWKVRNSERR